MQAWFFDGSAQYFDILAMALVVALLVTTVIVAARVALKYRRKHSVGAWRLAIRHGGVLMAALALLLTYWSVRIQSRLAADIALNASGEIFVEHEMKNENFRCIYEWHAFSDKNKCINAMLGSGKLYSEEMLYIEEVFFILKKAKSERKIWGAGYAREIKYWAADVSADPTGIFSYQLVAENPESFDQEMKEAGVSIDRARLCRNYREIWTVLAKKGANPDPLVKC